MTAVAAVGQRLAGKRAMVTGAAGGVGRTIASALAAEGAEVLGVDRAWPSGADAFSAFEGDVTDRRSIEAAVEAAAGTGGLDICIANAGIVAMDDWLTSDVETWRRLFDVNVLGVVQTLQSAGRRMIADGTRGRLLATASTAGIRSDPTMAAYCASKAAVIAFVQAAAVGMGPHGITVNAVAPGELDAGMNLVALAEFAEERGCAVDELKREVAAGLPARRLGAASDIAQAFVFLASDAAEYITGTTLRVDGGQLLV